ncbi:hypothetical protein [Sinosporangium siamense]|uniref:PknH-like extracellular domain-containing protein n=1 Tax=Sinosporangium siamense TaxID=1367973 RepID=A0A919V8R3_9ACTN|nr:hypothetical protein [Sinosporangium siamense]GII94713.1 hypothetical protein Ssi02_49440 [Sinosporangium siamense]
MKLTYKTIPALCLVTLTATACAAHNAAPAKPANSPTTSAVAQPPVPPAVAKAARALGAGLLASVDGMKKVYGPESGAFGGLTATRRGLEAMAKTKVDKPGCATTGQLDAQAPAVRDAPAAVVSFMSKSRTITEALIELPEKDAVKRFPGLQPGCEKYTLSSGDAKMTYTTRPVELPRRGDRVSAFLTSVEGTGIDLKLGSVALRRGNVVMSLLVVGSKVDRKDLLDQTDKAYAALIKVVK